MRASGHSFLRRSVFVCVVAFSLCVWGGCDDDPAASDLDTTDTATLPDGVTDPDSADAPDTDDFDGTVEGFNDRTVLSLSSLEDFQALSSDSIGIETVKFVLTAFDVPDRRAMRYMDCKFYTLHDEWYWFRLLNGQRVPGDEAIEPVMGLDFASIEEIYTWAKTQDPLPLDLKFVADGRLYSPRFYSVSLAQRPRQLGLGTLMHLPAYDRGGFKRDPIWAFELEFSDTVTHAELVLFFEHLEATLPADISAQVKWVVRSPVQEALARTMEAGTLRYYDRILRYDELSITGEVQVYSEGLAAGRLRTVPASGEGLDQSLTTDILLLGAIPDWLPPAAGLVTAVPQTPLAHINVLARNRGIPNAYRGGLLDDPALDQLARVRAPVIVEARAPDHLRIVQMTEEDYRSWRDLGKKPPISIPQVNIPSLPYVIDLSGVALADADGLRSSIGGKSAGIISLLSIPNLAVPERPLAITIRAYAEHMAQLAVPLAEMLNSAEFKGSARARFLMLEGFTGFSARYPTIDDATWRDAFLADHPPGDTLGDIVRANGFKRLLRDTPIPPATLAALDVALRAHYAALSPLQGLRFRSSSTVEDIEGFNGAGLYDSNTGFLFAEVQTSSSDQKKTIEAAIKSTWASYWGFEAFEERRLEAIDHSSGRMGVMVHPRFDDALEITNGVFLYTAYPPNFADAGVLELNVQAGDLSVTNPDSAALPEVDFVYIPRDPQASPRIERRQASTISATPLFSDAALVEIAHNAQTVTQAWLDDANASLAPEQRGRTQTLDFEFREMPPQWPAFTDGSQSTRRVVYKQARSLEPGLRLIPDALKNLPFPRDVVARTRRGERLTCTGDHLTLITSEVYTNPLATPDMGFTYSPFTAFVSVSITAALPELGLTSTSRLVAHHQQATFSHPDMDGPSSPWTLTAQPLAAAQASSGIQSVAFHPDLTYTLTATNGAEVTGAYTCEAALVYASPDDFLRRLLDQADP